MYIMYLPACLPAYMSVHESVHKGQQKVSDSLELEELETVLSLLTWVLRTELNSSGRAATTLNHGAASPAQTVPTFKFKTE